MAYKSKAYGQLVLGVGVDDIEARKSLQVFRKDVANATNDMRQNVRAAKLLGDTHRELSAKIDGSNTILERQKAFLKQITEALKHSEGATKQEIQYWEQYADKIRQSIDIVERTQKQAQIQQDAQMDKLAKLNHVTEENTRIRKANLEQMKAEGKEFGVIEKRIEGYNAALEESTQKLRTIRTGMTKLRKSGNTDSLQYHQLEVSEAEEMARKAQLKKVRDGYVESKPEDYAKARISRDGIDDYKQQADAANRLRKLQAEALKGTGNEEAAFVAQADARVQRMSDLAEIIQREENQLKNTIKDTETGTKIQTNIANARKEYSKLEDEQTRYENGLDNLNWANQKQISTLNTLSKMYEANGQHFKAQMVQSQTLRQEVDLLTDQYNRERSELSSLSSKYGENSTKTIEQKRKVSELASQMVNLNKRIIELDRSTGKSYGALQRFADYAEQHKNTFNALGSTLQVAGKGMMGFGAGVGLAIAQGVKLNNELDQTNNYTKALLQNAGREDPSEVVRNLSKAKKEDIELSQQYGISQNEIAKAQQTLAHRGYESNQVLAASKPLLQSAIATGYSLHDVTNIATSAVEAFGLRSKDTATMTKNTTKAINTMSYASDLSASSFNDTGVALSYVGSTAKAAGISMDQTAAAVGELSLNGIGAQKAGTGLRKIIQSLISPTANGKKVIQQLGLQIQDSHGKLLPFNKIMEELHDKMENMSKVQKVDLLKQLFGTTGQTAAAALVNNADALSKFNKEVAEANDKDYIGKLSSQNLNNPVTQINRLKQAWNEMTMQMADTFKPFVTGSIRDLANFIQKINDAGPVVHFFFNAFAIGIPIVGGLVFILGSVLKHVTSLTTNWNKFRALFDKDARANVKSAQSMNDVLIEQVDIMKSLNKQIAENNELNGASGGSNKIGNRGSGSSGNNLSNDIEDLKNDKNIEKDISETRNVSRWSKFKSIFRGSKATGTRFGSIGTDAKLAENATKDVGGISKIARIGGKGIAGLDIATALLDLVGTNKNNVGDHVGGTSGSIAGTLAGGALGSLIPIPGLGTAVGAGVGGWLGDMIGRSVGSGIQKALTPKKRRSQNPSGDKSSKSLASLLDEIGANSTAINAENSATKSKTSSGIIDSLDNSNKENIKEIVDKLKSDNNKVDKQASGDINTVNKLLNDYSNEKYKGKKIHKNAGQAHGNKYGSDAVSNEKGFYDKQYKEAEDAINALNKLHTKGAKERVAALQAANKKIETAEAASSAAQVEIQAKLAAAKGHMSDKEAGKLIATAENVRKKQVDAAENSYKKQKSAAEATYNARIDSAYRAWKAHSITKSQYDKTVTEAQTQRDKTIDAAKKSETEQIHSANNAKNRVVAAAKKQTKDHLRSVDEETGGTLNMFQQWYKSITGMFDDIGGWFQKILGGSKGGRKVVSTYKKARAARVKKDGDAGWLTDVNTMMGYAEGSDAIRGTQQALVNEKGQESAYNPKTNRFRLFNGGPQVTTLYDGERILNAQDTYKMLHGGLGNGQTLKGYANGTTTLGSDSGSQSSVKLKNVKSLDKFKKKSKDIWKSIHDDTKDKVDKTHDYTAKQLADMKKKSLNQFQGIHDGTINNTKDLVKNYNSIFGQLPTMTQTSVRGSIDQLNRGFAGINSTLNQFGSKNNVLQPIHYATGSNGAVAREHDAIVNDAMNGSQQEAILRNDGIFLPKYRNALVHLNAGDAVLNGSQTRNFLKGTGIAHYANGSGVSNEQLKKLISQGMANSTGQLAKDFGSKIGKVGSQLGTGYLDDTKGALNGQMAPWYKAIFQVLNDAEGNGTSASAFLKYAKENFAGKKYSLGADGPDLYDCSSMVEAALKHFGIQLGRTTTAMQASSQLTRLGDDISKARPGDLALFGHGDGAAGHVGIVNNPATGTMFNETPPAAGVTNIGDVTSVALDGFYRINALADKDTYKKSPLFGLAKKQLGKQRLDWVQKHLGNFGDFAGYIPTGDHASLLRQAGIPESDWSDFNYIISHESGWNVNATNPDGGAYGLPQALPASKMASAGDDWRNNPITQLKWMKGYINGRYGSADAARAYWQAHHNYENGGLITNEQIARVGEHNKPEMILPLTDKFRTVQLAKQAVDFVTASDRNQFKSGSSNVTSAQMEKDIANLNKNVDELVKAVNIIAQNSGLPTKAYITRQDLFKTINDGNKKAQMQAALRRGENIVQ